MGFKIFKAVRNDKLALYINPLSPLKLTAQVPISTSLSTQLVQLFRQYFFKTKKGFGNHFKILHKNVVILGQVPCKSASNNSIVG